MNIESQIPDLYGLVLDGKGDEIIQILKERPELKNYRNDGGDSLFTIACTYNLFSLCRFLVSIDAPRSIEDSLGDNLMQMSIFREYDEIFRLQLEIGFSPNVGRPALSAINRGGSGGLECLRLLIKHGLDVNQVFAMFGSRKNVRSALDFCIEKPEFAKVLKAVGAKTSAELLKANPSLTIVDAE